VIYRLALLHGGGGRAGADGLEGSDVYCAAATGIVVFNRLYFMLSAETTLVKWDEIVVCGSNAEDQLSNMSEKAD